MPTSQVISRLLKIDVAFKDMTRKTYLTITKTLLIMRHKIRATNYHFWILCYYERKS